jgi:hypothetical protein
MLHVVLYGNCQCQGLVFLLRYFYASISVEVEFSHIENYTLIKKSLPIDEQVLQQADIFIYQPIDKVHGPYSTDRTYQGNILSLLSKNCRQISFPYIYNSALWAFIPPADIDSFIGGFGETMRYINKEPLEDLFRSGFTLKQAITRFKRKKIEFNHADRFKKCQDTLKKKELLCDVTISDYIESNIRKKRLFLTQNHPTTPIFVECANQIISLLGYSKVLLESDFENNIAGFSKGWPFSDADLDYWKFDFKDIRKDNKFFVKHIKRMFGVFLESRIKPLSYSIPARCFDDVYAKKTACFSPLIPGKIDTYIYKTEEDYYNNYKGSLFGFTYKKGGWDCLRHYEIIANKCIPFFWDLNKCPERTLANFPKKTVTECMEAYQNGTLTHDLYEKYATAIYEYGRKKLTCEASADYVIKSLGKSPKKILMLGIGPLNYSRDLLAIGLRQRLGKNFIDYPRINHLYDGDTFTYTRSIDDIGVDRSSLKSKIREHYFDAIIIGSIDFKSKTALSKVPFWRIIRKHYKSDSLCFVFGGDQPPICKEHQKILLGYLTHGTCFIRELTEKNDSVKHLEWQEYQQVCRENWASNIEKSEQLSATKKPYQQYLL